MATSSSSLSVSAEPKLRRYLIARHGETNFNKEMREQGTLDTPVLTFDGISQAAGLGVYVARRQADGDIDNDGEAAAAAESPPISRTWCSPMIRCCQSYAAVSGCCSSPSFYNDGQQQQTQQPTLPNPTILSNLREIDLREWQGQLTQEIKEKDSENWNTFLNDPQLLRLDNGKFAPVLDCWERGLSNWNDIRLDAAAAAAAATETNNNNDNNNDKEEGATFIMCHGGMGQCMLLQALGINVNMFRKSTRFAFDNCGCVEVEWADGEECSRRWRRVHPMGTEW
eukprot:CAMPEP_0172306060 /NCGR_PEP_ID=MMETSP1058-20130122/7208_1 /TAXON_ID=83371 /ORGANISM="Detonula confervacea, Strain CCMP 353" /LENGTH=282 /DNA_ID=CAMNT_0013017831 /DNA_START=154 /DNA_END=999 /DNA_ORIENTATION=+